MSITPSPTERLRGPGPYVSVGILTADLASLGSELALLEEAAVELVHVDVMDGHFCPLLTVGPPLVKAMRTSMLKDVHLMIEEPLGQLESFIEAGADVLTIHVESTRHPHRALQALAGTGVVLGVALNPGTPVGVLEPLLDEVELVLVLAVNPGWPGQRFIPATARRLAAVRAMVAAGGKEVLVGVDGGITRENVAEVVAMGADIVVTGSAVFDGKAPAENARFMLEAIDRARARAAR